MTHTTSSGSLDAASLQAPEPPAEWECCNSDCGEACLWSIYARDKARYDAAVAAQSA
ncbi:MAG: oxidoreductase-like domain-containing protein [Neisseria sp.]|nr:oxidoreductase-like domain-containing protein [Neisseria sp.]